MCKKLLFLVLVLSLVGSASAARWYAYFDNATTNNNWADPLNWDCYASAGKTNPIARKVPNYDPSNGAQTYLEVTTTVKINAGDYAGARGLFGGNAMAGDILQSGGIFHSNGFWFGEAAGGATDTYTLTGGRLYTDGAWGQAFDIGAYSGKAAVVNVEGGKMSSGSGDLCMGRLGGTGNLNISGTGKVTVPDIMDLSLLTNGYLDIAGGGRLSVVGDKTDYMNAAGDGRYINSIYAGKITANGAYAAPSAFNCWYDADSGLTHLTVPEPTTIALLGLGGLALIRRKR